MAYILPGPVTEAIERFSPRMVSSQAASFAKELAAAGAPADLNRAKAFLYAASRLGAFAESVGLELSAEVVLRASIIERFCDPKTTAMSAATRRTVRSNLRAIARAARPAEAVAPKLGREPAKTPYSPGEIAAYLALCDAQPSVARRMRASGLVCLCAGAGLVGSDLKAVCGSDVLERCGGVVVCVPGGRCRRSVSVLARYHDRLLEAAAFAGDRLLIGGTSTSRRNVTTPITGSLAGGDDLPRIEIGRLRATWLCEVAEMIGLRAFMDAAGISCSQRLGDLVAHLAPVEEACAVALLGAKS